MAKDLNKNRIFHSKLALIAVFFMVLFTRSFFGEENPLHEPFEFIGYGLVALCALGRVYTTAFLGGFKNQKLVTYGPFSLMRNPLYFFSLLGMTGIALQSNHLVVMVALPILFWAMYQALIRREEGFLQAQFGEEYKHYMQTTPRLFPSFKNYNMPESLEMVPRFLNKAFADAIWWFLPFPLFELVEVLQDHHWLASFFRT